MRNGKSALLPQGTMRSSNERLRTLFEALRSAYGPQGWWPLPSMADTAGFDERGYHPRDYGHPKTEQGRMEIIVGAVLTQNTAWTNVETALINMSRAGIDSPAELLSCSSQRLSRLIKPSGYFNQKTRKLMALRPVWENPAAMAGKPPSRDELLSIWGIGEETADSILLYAFHRPSFVVDAYTRRLLVRLGWISGREKYGEIQGIFHAALNPRDHKVFNEYHALIVEHAKRHCRTKPLCGGCPVSFCPIGRL
jgi:endonuclease III related protein